MAKSRTESIPDPVDGTSQLLKRKSIQMHGHSSSSSIESSLGNNVNTNSESTALMNNPPLTATNSSTTTDSDFESEQDDNLHLQPHKSDSSASDQLSRRAKHFQKLFQSEINNDDMPEVIDSYVCAYQGDILLQGKLYITDRYLCFHSRIINYVTKHVYRWEQIDNVTKERVAFIFPTAIGIQLKGNNKKITYASFLQRDQAFEKILFIWSRFGNLSRSIDDDDDEDEDDNEVAQNGTLKANNVMERSKSHSRESYEVMDQSEQEVLQLCLKDNQQSGNGNSRKSSDEKQLSKKSDKKSSKNLNQEQKLSNGDVNINSSIRQSRYTKNEQKTKKNISSTNQRSKSRHRTPSRTDTQISSNNPSSSPSLPISTSNELPHSSSSSSQIYQNLSSLLPSYSLQTTIIILLILTLLFLHSFYLIQLAYRIENRLQSLHHLWPSASTPSVMKNSFSSNAKDL